MSETTLKPCPFCGGEPYFFEIYVRGQKVWKVMCGKRVDCCAILNDYNSQEEAAIAWNNRYSSAENTSYDANSDLLAFVKNVAETNTYPRYRELVEYSKKLLAKSTN